MDADGFAAIIAGLENMGLSRTEIAAASGISRTTVWRLSVGEARQPSYETISRLKNLEARAARVTDMKQG